MLIHPNVLHCLPSGCEGELGGVSGQIDAGRLPAECGVARRGVAWRGVAWRGQAVQGPAQPDPTQPACCTGSAALPGVAGQCCRHGQEAAQRGVGDAHAGLNMHCVGANRTTQAREAWPATPGRPWQGRAGQGKTSVPHQPSRAEPFLPKPSQGKQEWSPMPACLPACRQLGRRSTSPPTHAPSTLMARS